MLRSHLHPPGAPQKRQTPRALVPASTDAAPHLCTSCPGTVAEHRGGHVPPATPQRPGWSLIKTRGSERSIHRPCAVCTYTLLRWAELYFHSKTRAAAEPRRFNRSSCAVHGELVPKRCCPALSQERGAMCTQAGIRAERQGCFCVSWRRG